MKHVVRSAVVCLIFLGLVAVPAAPSRAAGVQAQPPAYDFEPLREYLKSTADARRVAGCSLLVTQDGKTIFREGFGLADVAAGKPFATDAIAFMASNTKWISATVLMTLVDDGLISLDDPIGKYLPAFKDMPVRGAARPGNPTIRQCLSHTSGMAGNETSTALSNRNITLQQSAAQIARENTPLRVEPGTIFAYGGNSFQVAGAIVEVVTGKPFEQYLRERVLKPLGMVDTSFSPDDEKLDRVPIGYALRNGQFAIVRRPPSGRPTENPRIAGGIYSTLDDYTAFLLMHLNRGRLGDATILSESAAAAVVAEQTGEARYTGANSRDGQRYGLGVWRNVVDANDNPVVVSHGGALGTFGWVDFGRKVTVVSITQMDDLPDGYLAEISERVNKAIDDATRAAGKRSR